MLYLTFRVRSCRTVSGSLNRGLNHPRVAEETVEGLWGNAFIAIFTGGKEIAGHIAGTQFGHCLAVPQVLHVLGELCFTAIPF